MHQSHSSKRSHLWNVQEPGDPYDIKKSMIAKLPNHPSKFMGDHLELICLLQAAEIERLSQYLSQIQCRYRQVEKKQLDRHSYEIQIKQLAEKNINYHNLKSDNQRLKDFIRRQTAQLEQLQKKNLQSMNMEALNAKYQSVLTQLGMARQQCQRSQQTISRLNIELTEWKHKYERIELEKTNLKSQFDLQINQRISIQIRKALNQSQERNSRLQLQLNQARQNSDNKNHEIQLLISQKDQLYRQLKQIDEKSRKQNSLQATIAEKNRQIQRLHTIIDQKTNRFEQIQGNLHRQSGELRVIQQKYYTLQKQRQALITRIKDLQLSQSKQSDLDKYEEKVAMMSMQIERLNNLGMSRNRQQQQNKAELDRLRYQLDRLRSQRDQLKRNQVDFSKLAAHEQKISLLSQQLQRVTYQLQSKKEQIRHLQSKFSQNQANSSQILILTTQRGRLEQQLNASRTQLRNYKSITQNQLSNLRSECSKLRQDLEHQSGSKSQLEKYRLECQRLRVELERIRNQSISYRRAVDELKINNERMNAELNRLVEESKYLTNDKNQLEGQKSRLKRQLDQYRNADKQLQQKNSIIRNLQLDIEAKNSRSSQIQATIQNVYKQIERLHSVLSIKTNELTNMAKQYSQLQQKCRQLENRLGSSSAEKQSTYKQVEQMNRQIKSLTQIKSELTVQIQSKSKEIIVIREQYQNYLRQKDRTISQHSKEKQGLERKIVELQRQLSQRIPHQEQISKDYQKIVQESKNKDLTIQRLQVTIRQIQVQIDAQEGKVKQYESRSRQWQNRFRDIQRLLTIKQQQKQRLNQDLARLKVEISNSSSYKKQDEQRLKQKIDALTQQNLKLRMRLDVIERNKGSSQEGLKLQLKRAEEAISFERKQCESLRQHIHNLTRQVESQREAIKQYQLKIVHIENTNSKMLQQKLRQKELKLQEKDGLIASLQQEVKSLENQFGQYVDKDRSAIANLTQYENKIALLSTQFQRLNQLVEQKTRQIREKEHIIQQLRGQVSQLKNSVGQSNSKDQQFIAHLKAQIDQLTRNIQEQDRVIEQLRRKAEQPVQVDYSHYQIQITNLKAALEQLQSINLHTIAERDELFKVSHEMKTEYDENVSRLSEQERQLRNQLQHRLEQNRARGEELGLLRKKQQSYIVQINELQARGRQEDPNLMRRLAQLEQQNGSLSHTIQELKIENTNLRTEINQLEIIIQEVRTRSDSRQEVSSLKIKINEYIQLLAGRDQDLVEWENKYTGLYTAYEQLYANYNLTKSQYEVTITNIKVYESKLFQLEQDFSALSQALRNTKRQLERYQNQNYQLQQKLHGDGDLYQKNILLSQQIDRLNTKTVQMQQDLADTRIRLTDGVSLNKRIEEHLGLFVVLFAEIESLRNRLASSEQECEQVRRSSLVPLRVDKSMGPRP